MFVILISSSKFAIITIFDMLWYWTSAEVIIYKNTNQQKMPQILLKWNFFLS